MVTFKSLYDNIDHLSTERYITNNLGVYHG